MMPAPAYQRIKDYIQTRVHGGHWREGDLIPSEHELLRRFRVSRMTVNRALRELTAEQVLTRVKGSGTFVARTKYASTLVAIRGIAQEISVRGHTHRCDVLLLERGRPVHDVAAQFQVNGRIAFFHSRLLHRENGVPIQLEACWVNPAVAPDYERQDFTRVTPNEYLMAVAPLQRVEYRIEARAPDAATRRLLTMHPGEPCLVLHRRTWSRGQVASVAELRHPGARYQFEGHF